MNIQTTGFKSPLSDGMNKFLKCHRALGRRFNNEESSLRLLDHFLVEREVLSIESITESLLEEFLASRNRNSRSYNHLLSTLHRLFNWLVAQQQITVSPLHTKPRKSVTRYTPYLFTPEQFKQLLKAASELRDNPYARHRAEVYPMIFILMYGLGLRVSEATKLRWKDVNTERCYFVIRKAKFSKSRLVPFGPKIAKRLQDYIEDFDNWQPDSLLFSFTEDHQRLIIRQTVSRTFQSLLPQLNLKLNAGVSPPRLHCLRHSFAVGTLLRWYQQGEDPSKHLIYLSTFMGHVNPSSTAVYLTINGDILNEASQRFNTFASSFLKEIIK